MENSSLLRVTAVNEKAIFPSQHELYNDRHNRSSQPSALFPIQQVINLIILKIDSNLFANCNVIQLAPYDFGTRIHQNLAFAHISCVIQWQSGPEGEAYPRKNGRICQRRVNRGEPVPPLTESKIFNLFVSNSSKAFLLA